MTELDLYKFTQDDVIEIGWHGNKKLYVWMSPYQLEKFSKLLNRCDADDGGIDCKLQDGGIINLDLALICEEYDIDPENILPKEKSFFE